MTGRRPVDFLPTDRQLHLRSLAQRLAQEEMPLDRDDLRDLQHFVQVVRYEIVEETTATHRRATRVNYYLLNDRGRRLLAKWERGLLDHRVTN